MSVCSYVDLDRFKEVNDSYGHGAGDEVLLASAHRLSASVRPQDTVARLGGDEFAVCAPRITTEGLASLASRITDALAQPLVIHGRSLQVGASVGSHLAVSGGTVQDAVRLADRAMYEVKEGRQPGGRRGTGAGTELRIGLIRGPAGSAGAPDGIRFEQTGGRRCRTAGSDRWPVWAG